ncbi:MAG TPA: FAD-dependent oxidoreductase [Casimicrobiaceae bacterium]|nr:FAD-dependent oxidoreductase [Casimicrobiaceae bacterium]
MQRGLPDPSVVTRRRESGEHLALECDLCVVGSGAAGAAAAIEAGRLGLDVVLVDGAPQVGGQATGAIIDTFCGFYSVGPQPELLTFGIAEEIVRDLTASDSMARIEGRRNTIILYYRHTALQRWIEDALVAARVTVLTGALLREARLDSQRIRSLSTVTRYGEVDIRARNYVDASGDAALTWIAGLAVHEPAHETIYGSQNGIVRGVDVAALDRAGGPEIVKERVAQKAQQYGLERKDAFVYVLPGTDQALVNMTHLATPLDPMGASRMVIEGHEAMDRSLVFLKAEFPDIFGRASIDRYGMPGVRQTRWIKGRYQLTVDDVRSGRAFPDAIARCAWGIELHNTPEGTYWEGFPDGHVHYIPYRSMLHAEADNLLAAGRCIDGDVLALSSVRVMGPCIAMGTAAAHAAHLAGAAPVSEVDVDALRRRVARNLGAA